ncbi:MAG: hypothetical protein IKZ02_03725, partial [Alphaproteobacteria bacterium]|nr:hypothetical protein [Alphaproteobacteria bacterium]
MTNPIRDIEYARMWLSLDTLRISPKNLSPESIRKIEQICAERGLSCIRGSQGVLRISGNPTEIEVLHKAISKRMMPSPMIQAIQRATQQGAQVARQATQRTIQTTANLVRTISTSPEVTGAMVAAGRGVHAVGQGARAVGRTARGGAPLLMAMAAVDPEGTAEFMDDVAHFRVGKIATDMYEGGKQLVLHPIDTASAIGGAIADKTANYYEGTDGFLDGAGRTAMIPAHGLVNIGNVEWAVVGSVGDATQAGINWVLDTCGSNTELVREGTSMRDFQRDPLEFFGNVFAPARRDRTTGLRSDDDFNTLIFRGDTTAFAAYLNTGVNVNTRIAGEHDRGIHHYQTAFALAIAEDQFDI